MAIGTHLRQLRLERGMTQEEVAQQLGITRQALSSYESERTRPDIDMLMSLCRVYETDLDGILYGRERTLKALRRIRILALLTACGLVALTLISSALLWSAGFFFPVTEGMLTGEELTVLRLHQRVTAAWEAVDSVILVVSLLSFLALLLLKRRGNCRVLLGWELTFALGLSAGLLLAAAPFAFADAAIGAVNYFITPLFVIARMLLFLALDLLLGWLEGRKSRAG